MASWGVPLRPGTQIPAGVTWTSSGRQMSAPGSVRGRGAASSARSVTKDPGVNPENVMVVFKETQWENWAFGGGRQIHA